MKLSPETIALLRMMRAGKLLVAGPGIKLTRLPGGQIMISLATESSAGAEFDISYLDYYDGFEFPGP